MEIKMIYAAFTLLGFVLGIAAVFGYLNLPDENERMYNDLMKDRYKVKS